jgi:hypothetical protein
MSPLCKLEDLTNESDVEQKLLFPLLTASSPEGLDYAAEEVKTKNSLRTLVLDKGKSKKVYRPDYAVLQQGLPVLVGEAKHPTEDASEGFREARLYATEFNSLFPSDINPCQYVFASNGHHLLYGRWDCEEPTATIAFNDLVPTNPEFADMLAALRKTALSIAANAIRRTLNLTGELIRPINLVGGVSFRNEEVGYNQFGAQLSVDFVHLFNPQTRSQRLHIARNAYISSKRREHYTDEIDRVVKNALPRKKAGTQLIEDTDNPAELLHLFGRGKELQSKILLLIGSVGAGKSTFVDYFRATKLPELLRDSTLWVTVDFKINPPTPAQFESWVIERIIAELQDSEPEVDFDDWETQQKIFGIEIRNIKKGAISLLKGNTALYNEKLYEEFSRITSNRQKVATSLARYLTAERGKLLVLVFDNADKGDQEQQLQAFQVVQWIQSWLPCVVFLPIRDVTYETYKLKPPLDTIIKEFIFRIEPPQFTKVLKSRVMLALKELERTSPKAKLSYTLDNGMAVVYPATEIGIYLAAIYRSLYDHDQILRRMLVGLAGRNIRLAMEIFLDFCKSGHIGTKELLKIRITKGNYSLPYKVITRVLLRLSRRFYDSDYAHIKNLFQADPKEHAPNHFVRYGILEWLRLSKNNHGPSGARGFHLASSVASVLVGLGISVERVMAELLYLVKAGCIYTERQRTDEVSLNELVILAPAGYATLGLVARLDYLAACSEDTWIQNEGLAKRIASRIGAGGLAGHYNRLTTRLNAQQFALYLTDIAKTNCVPSLILDETITLDIGSDIQRLNERVKQYVTEEENSDWWHQFTSKYTVGDECAGTVDGMAEFGVFVRFDEGPIGLIHSSHLTPGLSVSDFNKGDKVQVEILRIDAAKERISLQYLDRMAN